MKIFGICLVKNESDIIREVLSKALAWCDYIFVYDNGSEDDTWEIVHELSKQNSKVIPYKKLRQPFRDGLRGEVFNHYRHLADEGDWWCRLDADEIYLDDPRDILQKVSKFHHVVFNESYQYYFTDKDYEAWLNNPIVYDHADDYERVLRYYRCDWSEIRFFKYRKGLKWDGGAWPLHLGIVSPLRVRLKHLQYRSPGQIELRLKVRQLAVKEGHLPFESYSNDDDWRKKVVESKSLFFDKQNGVFEKNETMLPNHLEQFPVRLLKYIFHTFRIWP